MLDCGKPVNGGWTDWICDLSCNSCGSGTKSCTRSCTNPEPSCGGAGCSGAFSDTLSCQLWTPQSFTLVPGTETLFGECADDYRGVVPAGVTQITFGLWGGGGGGGSSWVGGTVLNPVSESGLADVPGGLGGTSYNGTAGRGGIGFPNSGGTTTGAPGLVRLSL
jgi:hypothetical protein